MGIDNAKGIRIKQMTEYTVSIAVLFFSVCLFFVLLKKPEKYSDKKIYIFCMKIFLNSIMC